MASVAGAAFSSVSATVATEVGATPGRDRTPVTPGASRIADLLHQGRPVDPYEGLIVATNDHRAGSDSFPKADGPTVAFEASGTDRDVIVRCILGRGPIDLAADGSRGLLSMPGTTALLDTGSRTAERLGKVPGLAIEPTGGGPEGFVRISL